MGVAHLLQAAWHTVLVGKLCQSVRVCGTYTDYHGNTTTAYFLTKSLLAMITLSLASTDSWLVRLTIKHTIIQDNGHTF